MVAGRSMRNYSREEIEEIFRRAVGQGGADGASHDDLVEAAQEIGLDRSAVESAVAELDYSQWSDELAEATRRRHRQKIVRAAVTLIVVSSFFAVVDWLSGEGWWFYWVGLTWALVWVLRARRALFPSDEEFERDQHQEAKRRRWKSRPGKSMLESRIEDGVRALSEAVRQRKSR